MSASLYERLGGTEAIARIASDIVDLHRQNPLISTRFGASDPAKLKAAVTDFFVTGSGGPECYKGRDMKSAHAHMNTDHAEFMAVLDDVLKAMQHNKVGRREMEEVLFILYSMRDDIIRT
ncbi:group 1 truncated hemoglobin [Motiliproteus coralliicola]|uniref:Group 1 truncated hemoglobin n=1 Tax=Motiliproteus coralliicola TaxID=2283196 RepID=A0A369WS98_9GAMM|nr:group 1 truncated hemoglobin [Motiliproteus coralliicola]RDE24053.1 group 1 truncated hemoglobin [Motiliproteus coralliicola]